ncbi:hypothetical protein DOY81_012795 [Sarcophaga bullata]|nr:hypothetical protein DOY81_012795 [Sarcophaga bullata]
MKYCVAFLYLLCIWEAQHFAMGETKSITDDISEEIYSGDYTRFESQLERLNLQTKINYETQLNHQQQLFNKIHELSLQIKGIEEKLLEKHETEAQVSLVTPTPDNKRLIKNHLYGPESFLVLCREDDGVWTVIQRRIDGSVDFYCNWSEYKTGFGNVDGEFFIGLAKLHALTSTLKPVELLIQIQDFDNVMKYAKYDDFQISNESQNYKLISAGSYTSNAGDSFSLHVGYNFSTKDRDNDFGAGNCAIFKTAGWWYKDCGWSNLNGKYYHDPTELKDDPTDKRGINWNDFHGYKYSLKFVQMLIRPRNPINGIILKYEILKLKK